MSERPKGMADRRHSPVTTGVPVFPPLTALIETAVLFIAIYGLDALMPGLGLLDLSPHPFWIPVLLVSLQYGTVSGFIAAAVAIALTLFAGLPEQDIGENLFAYFLRVWGQPILWIGVALLVGQFRMRQLAAKHELRLTNAALTRQRDDLARHSGDLRERIQALEQELATRYSVAPHATAAILAKTIAAGGLGVEGERQSVFHAAASALFPGAVLAAYCMRNGALSECAVAGRPADRGPRIRIEADEPLYRAVIEQGRVLSVLDAGHETILKDAGLAAAPIPGEAAGTAFGMIVIEKADPLALSEEGIAALDLLAQSLSPRLPLERRQRPRLHVLPRILVSGARSRAIVVRQPRPVTSRPAEVAATPSALSAVPAKAVGVAPAARTKSLMERLQPTSLAHATSPPAKQDVEAKASALARDGNDATTGAPPNQ